MLNVENNFALPLESQLQSPAENRTSHLFAFLSIKIFQASFCSVLNIIVTTCTSTEGKLYQKEMIKKR